MTVVGVCRLPHGVIISYLFSMQYAHRCGRCGIAHNAHFCGNKMYRSERCSSTQPFGDVVGSHSRGYVR